VEVVRGGSSPVGFLATKTLVESMLGHKHRKSESVQAATYRLCRWSLNDAGSLLFCRRRFAQIQRRREALEQWTCERNTLKFSRMKSCSEKEKHGAKFSVNF